MKRLYDTSIPKAERIQRTVGACEPGNTGEIRDIQEFMRKNAHHLENAPIEKVADMYSDYICTMSW